MSVEFLEVIAVEGKARGQQRNSGKALMAAVSTNRQSDPNLSQDSKVGTTTMGFGDNSSEVEDEDEDDGRRSGRGC